MILLINEELEVAKPLEEVQRIISESSVPGCKVKQISSCEFKVVANLSVGTMFFEGGRQAVEGIKIYAEIYPEGSGKTVIQLRSHLRPELYLVLVFGLVVTVVQLQQAPPDWFVLGIFPFMWVWFWLVYRVQENFLLKKVKKHLGKI